MPVWVARHAFRNCAAAMSEWPIWCPVRAGAGRGAASRYLAVWLVTVQLSPAAAAGKQQETANVITQTDRRSGAGMSVLAAPGTGSWLPLGAAARDKGLNAGAASMPLLPARRLRPPHRQVAYAGAATTLAAAPRQVRDGWRSSPSGRSRRPPGTRQGRWSTWPAMLWHFGDDPDLPGSDGSCQVVDRNQVHGRDQWLLPFAS
jgi:hypothetical protein